MTISERAVGYFATCWADRSLYLRPANAGFHIRFCREGKRIGAGQIAGHELVRYVTSYKPGEPDRSLFRLPAGYLIQ